MKLDERHLIQLAAVVHARGVSEGAALLGLTQPAVSRTLALLERRVGEPLFVKGRRPLQATALGRALATHGQSMLAASRRAASLIDDYHRGASGLVRVGGTPFFMDGLISGMIAAFQDSRPDISVEQSYGYLADLTAAIEADKIDIAICPVDVLPEKSGLSFQVVLPGRNVVACRVTHPLLGERQFDPTRLLDFPWIGPPLGAPLEADLRSLALSLGATEIRVRYQGGSLASVLNYMKASDALTILPHSVVFAYRNEKSIAALPVTVPHPDRALGLLSLSDSGRSPAINAFCKHIASSFDSLALLIRRHEQILVRGS